MKTNILSYTASKNYVENGTSYRIDVKIQLTDECKNGVCHWSITADIYGKRQNGRFVWCSGGCCHNEISKHFPEFSKFVALHLSDCYGAPLYAVENGYYHMKNSSKETVIDYLRITETEYNLLCQSEDKQYFKYLIYTMGIVNRWNEESKAAIKDLEALTGNEWVNPYEYDKERELLTPVKSEREAFPLENIHFTETGSFNGVRYYDIEGSGIITSAKVRVDIQPGDVFNVYTNKERKYAVTYDGVGLNRSLYNALPGIIEFDDKIESGTLSASSYYSPMAEGVEFYDNKVKGSRYTVKDKPLTLGYYGILDTLYNCIIDCYPTKGEAEKEAEILNGFTDGNGRLKGAI